ncbi:MAG: DNA damage-inducible protein D [Acidobacteriota bacterium]|jgi:DNA-damage-inducible protein D|nr:DNA damage-inducible protein D [Acidobacteriota bacterium]
MATLNSDDYKSFEGIKHIRDNGAEYWNARELASVLEYAKWENFSKVIDRAMIACKNSGFPVEDHFPEVRKMIGLAKTATRPVVDYELTRYACYLIVQNGDPRKKVIALGQTYFAIQTRRAEVADAFNQLDENNKRLVVRGNIKQWNLLLAEAAHNAGVITDEEFAVFQNAGYMGLYGGMTVADIHAKKDLRKNEKILDYMGSTELIANLFRISQTEEKLKRDEVSTAIEASNTHYEVAEKIRKAIIEMGATLPENLPKPAKSIQAVERDELKKLHKPGRSLMLDE